VGGLLALGVGRQAEPEAEVASLLEPNPAGPDWPHDAMPGVTTTNVPEGTIAYFNRAAYTTGAAGGWLFIQDVGSAVVPLRSDHYPALAAIWDNDEDDGIFADA
jgi:hypothetical protein